MRWATVALCLGALFATVVMDAPAGSAAVTRQATGPAMSLSSQSVTVTPGAPWFYLAVALGPGNGPTSGLRVSMAVYPRIDDASELQQAQGATPDNRALNRFDLTVARSSTGMAASTCVTVLRDADDTVPTPPAGTSGTCTAPGQMLDLGCTPDNGSCGDVYPVSVSLTRSGTTLARFTTFLTYVEPGIGRASALRVATVLPATASSGSGSSAQRRQAETTLGVLSTHHNVPMTLTLSPTLATALSHGSRAGRKAVTQAANLTGALDSDELLDQPYVPVNLSALAGAGLTGEVTLQQTRGDQLLSAAGLHPASGTWVDADSTLNSATAAGLATGLDTVHASHLIVSGSDLSPAGPNEYTFAQPFRLDLGHGQHVAAAAADDQVDSRFTANTADPVLAANQLLASLSFVHFENVSLGDPRGVVITPPAGWTPGAVFLNTLLTGLADNSALDPVTVSQFFTQVPEGVNMEPGSRHLQSGANPGGLSASNVTRIGLDRTQLSSFSAAVKGHPHELTVLSDVLLATENRSLTSPARRAALDHYSRLFSTLLGTITIASERTVTFTSRTAPIPVTVLSTAPFQVTVVITVSSDKFTFPDGNTVTRVLSRATTPVRIQARSRTSGDRLPVDVTLRTPDGGLIISHTVLTVHSTSISIVGIGLTVLAGLVLLVWWGRTWRRGRRRRPRAH